MDRLQPKLIKPESTLIEQVALKMAAAVYEGGRSAGLKSKYKTPEAYARAYVEKFIPKAVDTLMDMLGMPHVPQEQKDAIYDALMERANDKDLSNIGIPVFENPLAATFIPDTKDTRGGPLVINTPKKKHKGRIEDLPLANMLFNGVKING